MVTMEVSRHLHACIFPHLFEIDLIKSDWYNSTFVDEPHGISAFLNQFGEHDVAYWGVHDKSPIDREFPNIMIGFGKHLFNEVIVFKLKFADSIVRYVDYRTLGIDPYAGTS